ncbi:unnamed protein product [Clonostachys rosea]|uniref:PWI domain-containing protein n=1 Tax=Bionectria ochroleuca TaxID=29856 RepID=A0ABY6UR45_BIOOC|nr:unnamed protein product [Clonostachys rosea]
MASGVDARLLKSTKFPPEFSQKVDMQKVNVQVIKKWIANRISDILGNEDDVVIELCFNLVEGVRHPDVKALQIQLTGFLEKDTAAFCKELWNLLLSAQASPQGVPKELLEAKKLELMQEKVCEEPMTCSIEAKVEIETVETVAGRISQGEVAVESAHLMEVPGAVAEAIVHALPTIGSVGRVTRTDAIATIREEEATAVGAVDGDGDVVPHVRNPLDRLLVAVARLQAEASAQIVATQGRDQGLDRGSPTEGGTVLVEPDDHARPHLTVILPHRNDAGILLQEAGLLADVRGHYLAHHHHLGDIQAPAVVAADGMRPQMREAGDIRRAVAVDAVLRGTGKESPGAASRVERRIRHATPQAYHSHLFGEKTLMFRKMHHLSIPEPNFENRGWKMDECVSPQLQLPSLPRNHKKAEIIRWWLSSLLQQGLLTAAEAL